MRKTLLFAAALCLASTTAMAQTYADPLQIQPGDNTYQASETGSYYWKFVADDDYIATIASMENLKFLLYPSKNTVIPATSMA